MPSTIPLGVAIYENPEILHWSLFIDAANKAEKTIVHIIGARQKFFPQIRTPSDARESTALIELVDLCQINAADAKRIKNLAYAMPIRNENPDYSCQDYVLDLLELLEDKGIVVATLEYKDRKRVLAAKRQSWKNVG
ncbi:hypothetical protein BJX70DRAFT_403825 [Aspergillus crustosus]